jgi:phospholipid/cholesterol/gamma-HCH transport system substrate-binding protein
MNHNQMTARVGLFFIIGVALIWVTFEALHNGRFSAKEGYVVTAPFRTLKELKSGDEVRMAGVQIGVVETTRLAKGRAEAVLRISPEVKIAQDSVATIAMAGLLGANYVALEIGTPESGTIPVGGELRTKDAADLNQIVADLGNLGQDLKGAIGQISGALGSGSNGQGGLFQKLDRLVTENGVKITNTMTNLEDITGKIRTGEGTLGKLVNDPTAYNELLATVTEIRAAASEAKIFIANTQSIVDQVKSGKGTLGALLYDEEAGQNIKIVAKNLRDVSDKMNSPNSTFGQLISNDTLIRDAQSTLRKVDRAVDSMGDSGPISAVGVVAGALF